MIGVFAGRFDKRSQGVALNTKDSSGVTTTENLAEIQSAPDSSHFDEERYRLENGFSDADMKAISEMKIVIGTYVSDCPKCGRKWGQSIHHANEVCDNADHVSHYIKFRLKLSQNERKVPNPEFVGWTITERNNVFCNSCCKRVISRPTKVCLSADHEKYYFDRAFGRKNARV